MKIIIECDSGRVEIVADVATAEVLVENTGKKYILSNQTYIIHIGETKKIENRIDDLEQMIYNLDSELNDLRKQL